MTMKISTTSYWAKDWPPLAASVHIDAQRVDTVVVGGGLAGLSAAYHLLAKRPDREVTVVEAKRVGAGASSCSTGMLTPGVGQNLAGQVSRFGPERVRRMYEATLAAVRYVAALIEREGIDCDLRMGGQLVIARGRHGRRRVGALANLMESLQLPCEPLDDDALAARLRLAVPLPDRSGSPAGVRLPTAGTLDPAALVQGLAERVRARGGIIHEGARVTDIAHGPPAIVTLANGTRITADHVVLAVSGFAADLGIHRGRILPVHLAALVTEPLSDAQREHLGWEGHEGVIDSRRLFNYFQLTRDHRIVLGGGLPKYRWGSDTTPDPGADNRIRALEREYERTFPAEARPATERGWTGLIGYVVDTMPTISRLTTRPEVLHIGGWSGHGIAMSVAAGQWIEALLTSGEHEDHPWHRSRPPLVPFEPVRWAAFGAIVRVMSMLDGH